MQTISFTEEWIKEQVSENEWVWIEKQRSKNAQIGFVAAARKIQRTILPSFRIALTNTSYSLIARAWTLDRLVRIYLLQQLPAKEPTQYYHQLKTLIDSAEINEAVAIYSGLTLLPFAEHLNFLGTEAVRTNIGQVFDAFAFDNPYAAIYFSDAEWNQLILKTIFNQKPIHLIVGLDGRNNFELARSISDFAQERWAAHRSVPPQIWRLYIPFSSSFILADLNRLLKSEDVKDRQAACLVIQQSPHTEIQALKNQTKDWNTLTPQISDWTDLEEL